MIVDPEDVRRHCQALIDADHSCHHYQDEDGMFQIRFADFEPYSCGGTHVQSLGEIGTLVLKSVKTKRAFCPFSTTSSDGACLSAAALPPPC